VVTKVRFAFALLGLLTFLAGCGDDGVSGFTGGSNSKDKQPIPSAVSAGVAQAATPEDGAGNGTPAVEGPVASSKAPEVEDTGDSDQPIRENSMKYRADRMRDPFISLIGGDDIYGEIVDLSVVKLVGVVHGEAAFAVVEDAEGTAYVLRKGDRVKNGRVVDVRETSVVCSQTILGYTTTVRLKLEEGKEGKNVG